METLYEDAFIVTKKGILDNSFEVIGKKEIESAVIFSEILVEIEQEVADYDFKNIIFVVDKIKYYPDETRFKMGFLPDLNRLGVKKLALVVGENKKIETFHKEFVNSLKSIEENLDIKIVVFTNIASAMEWIENKPYIQTGKLLNL